MCVEGNEFLIFFKAFTNERGFEAELPDGKKDMVEQLKAYADAETGFAGAADRAAAAVEEGGVAVSVRSGCGAEDVEQGVYGVFALAPEKLSGFLGAEEGGVFLYCYILEAAVLAFG